MNLQAPRIPGQFNPRRSIEDGPFATYVRTTQRAVPALRTMDLEPNDEDLKLVSALAYETDALADALALAIRHEPPLAAQLEKGLAEGIATLTDPPDVLVKYLDYYENIPAWADYGSLAARAIGPDWQDFEDARVPLTRIPTVRVFLDAVALASGFYVGANYPAVGQSLLATGAVEKGNSRIVQTARWAEETFETPGSLARFGVGIQSSAKVRLAHAFARQQIAEWGRWDEDYYGKPISAFDNMVFLSALLLLPDIVTASGAPVDPRWIELRRVQTRTVQYLLGAPQRLVTMPDDQMKRFFVVVVGHLEQSPDTARAVTHAIRHSPHFRPVASLRDRIQKTMTLLVANMFVRQTWGNTMANAIGLETRWMGVPMRWLSRMFFRWIPRMLRPFIGLAARMGRRTRVLDDGTTYRGSAGNFTGRTPQA
jgi:hypothetical protein